MNEQSYHKLIVWKEAHKFALDVYQATEFFPKEEQYAIKSQLRRAAVSIPTNLVEGNAKRSARDFSNFINISEGSSKECAYLLELARDLNYLNQERYDQLESQRAKTDFLLHRLRSSIQKMIH